jgi:hypothetical protein
MTSIEQLTFCATLEARLEANLAQMYAFTPRHCEIATRPYKPNFTMIPEPQIWSMPHPKEAARGRDLYAAGFVFGLATILVSLSVALVKT